MEINQHCVAALTWVLKDAQGEELDALEEPVEFFIGGADLPERVQQALQGHGAGDELPLYLEPEHAFGEYQEQLLFLEPRALFAPGIEEGTTIAGAALPKGVNPEAPRALHYTVAQLYPEHVVLDANHPLAGIALRLHLKVHGVRAATEEEISSGTAGTAFYRA
jgi:FKBP-type peptidyl-prolyl cis-trans isomerase SlyD